MARIANMVDAGYLLSACYMLQTGSQRVVRRHVVLDGEELFPVLTDKARELEPNGDLLRIYWYDAPLPNGLTEEQKRLRNLDYFKLRLGTLNSMGVQKGVDTLIVLDMLALSERRSVESILLVSGDEDLLAAVEIVQQRGVKVHLVGIDNESHPNQSPRLVQECDTSTRLKPEDVERFFAIFAPEGNGADPGTDVGQTILATVRNWGQDGKVYFTYSDGTKKAMIYPDQIPSEILARKDVVLAAGMMISARVKHVNAEGAILTLLPSI
ncbi:MAG: NYN domain-containing protein [Hyphomicrobiaceae bacterium]